MHNARGIDEFGRRLVRTWVNQNRMKPGIIVVLAIEQKNASLRRDRHPDLVRHLQPAAAFELFLGQKNANELLQLGLFVARQEAVIRHSLPQDAEPGHRERLPIESPPSPFSKRLKHRRY